MGCYQSTGQDGQYGISSANSESRRRAPSTKARNKPKSSTAPTKAPTVRPSKRKSPSPAPLSGTTISIDGIETSSAPRITSSAVRKSRGKQTLQDLTMRVKVGERKASGGYSDVYQGTLACAKKGKARRVAVKQFRVFDADKQAVIQELSVWASLKHENILPLLGYTSADGFRLPALITEFMEDGSLTDYMKIHPNDDLMRLASGIASGLAHMHSKNVVHAELKPGNILVSAKGTPLIADIGTTKLKERIKTLTISGLRGSDRFTAIELLFLGENASAILPPSASDAKQKQNQSLRTKSSDVWSFAMVIYQLLSGMVPYYEIAVLAHLHVALYLNRERRPIKPENMASSSQGQTKGRLWGLCETCWKTNPEDRPSMRDVCSKLARK